MNIFIMSSGSRGDVQPYVALGVGLKKAGHEVTICTCVHFKDFIEEQGLSYGYVNDEMIDFMHSDLGRDVMQNSTNVVKLLYLAMTKRKMLIAMEEHLMSDTWAACQKAMPDLIVYHPKTYGGAHFGEKLGVPVIFTLFQPIFGTTGDFPAAGFPNWKLGGWYNKLTFYIVLKLSRFLTRRFTDQWRTENGLSKQKRSHHFLKTNEGEDIPIVYGLSPAVLNAPKEWADKKIKVFGAWHLEEEMGWKPSKDLMSFLENGPAPVYVGFGSMAGTNPKKMARIVIEALSRANVRGVLSKGWGGLEAEDLPENIFQVEMVPHAWLFPKMAAIIHHGGAGTTAASLRSGKPNLVCPFLADQPYWGQQVYELGVGPKPIPQKKLSVKGIATAIEEMMSSKKMIESAKTLGLKMNNEDGVGDMVEYLSGITNLKTG